MKKKNIEQQKESLTNSIRQLKGTLRASLLTLLLGIALALGIPQIRAYLFPATPTQNIVINFETPNPRQASLLFSYPTDGADPVQLAPEDIENENQSANGQDLQQRIELLARRFQRGEFSMLSLSRLQDQPFTKILAENQEQMLVATDWSAPESIATIILRLQPSASREVRLALQEFVAYLQKNWIWSIPVSQ